MAARSLLFVLSAPLAPLFRYGMVLARHRAFPTCRSVGMRGLDADPVLFTSEEAHYSVAKGANWMGLGTESVVKVRTDAWGRMTGEALEEAVTKAKAEGKRPFFVNATAGTTVMGAFDDLESLAQVCKRHGLWLHLDACWGGGAVLSRRHRHLLKGSHLVDSIAWNLHKMIGSPVQCSAFVTRHEGLLQRAVGANATYLFQQDKFYDVSYDTGDKSIQCGRKPDGFKVRQAEEGDAQLAANDVDVFFPRLGSSSRLAARTSWSAWWTTASPRRSTYIS